MRTLLFLMPGIAIMALAFWAYSENYETQEALRDVAALRSEIARDRETLQVLRAEWAYLNRPDRLRALVALNDVRLELMPLSTINYARPDGIAPKPMLPFGPPEDFAAAPIALQGLEP